MNNNDSDYEVPRKNSVAERIAALQRKNVPTKLHSSSQGSTTRTIRKASNRSENTNIASRITAMQNMQHEIGSDKSNNERKFSGKVSALAAGMKGLDMKAMLSGGPPRKSAVRNSVDSSTTVPLSDDVRIGDLCHVERVTIGHGRRRGRRVNSIQGLKLSTE